MDILHKFHNVQPRFWGIHYSFYHSSFIHNLHTSLVQNLEQSEWKNIDFSESYGHFPATCFHCVQCNDVVLISLNGQKSWQDLKLLWIKLWKLIPVTYLQFPVTCSLYYCHLDVMFNYIFIPCGSKKKWPNWVVQKLQFSISYKILDNKMIEF